MKRRRIGIREGRIRNDYIYNLAPSPIRLFPHSLLLTFRIVLVMFHIYYVRYVPGREDTRGKPVMARYQNFTAPLSPPTPSLLQSTRNHAGLCTLCLLNLSMTTWQGAVEIIPLIVSCSLREVHRAWNTYSNLRPIFRLAILYLN